MTERLLAALERCGSAREARRLVTRAEDAHAPAELAVLLTRIASFPEHVRTTIETLPLFRRLRDGPPEPYVRRVVAEGVTFYAAPGDGRGRKTLLVVFCGQFGRPMIPTAGLLQCLPADRFDVLVLVDSARTHHLGGHGAYAAGLPELVAAIERDFRPSTYRRFVAFGTSMGGLAALRFGKLAGCDRAVAIGALPIWHINRLTDPTQPRIQAFDPLCACTRGRPCDMVCVFSAGNRDDARTAAECAARFGARRVPIHGGHEHNVLNPLWQTTGVRAFLLRHIEADSDRRARPFRRLLGRLRRFVGRLTGRPPPRGGR